MLPALLTILFQSGIKGKAKLHAESQEDELCTNIKLGGNACTLLLLLCIHGTKPSIN
jgi:hypothetical protein